MRNHKLPTKPITIQSLLNQGLTLDTPLYIALNENEDIAPVTHTELAHNSATGLYEHVLIGGMIDEDIVTLPEWE